MNKLKKSDKNLSREFLANPFIGIPYEERLEKAGAIDLRDNCEIIDLENGYSKVVAIDETKLFKRNK